MIFGNFMSNPQMINQLWAFWAIVVLIWFHRIFRLFITLLKTPQIKKRSPASFPPVSVLIPAKNEEKNIRACVESLQKQTYPAYELIVVNDNSSDQTETILQAAGVRYLNCPPAAEGWTGKTNALHHGSLTAQGEWLLFTDADTRHQPESLSSVIAFCQANQLDFLSLLPFCITGSAIEDILQPSAMAYLGLWFPMEKVNDPQSSLYFANGQFLLIKRSLYNKIGGHQAVAKEFLEDFALMKLSKKTGAKTCCAFGHQVYGTRMYDSWGTIWRGWRRIYLHAFEQQPWILFQKALSVFFSSFLPFVIWLWQLSQSLPASLLMASTGFLILILGVIASGHRTVRAKPSFALLHMVAALTLTGILLDASVMAFRKAKTVWR